MLAVQPAGDGVAEGGAMASGSGLPAADASVTEGAVDSSLETQATD